MCQSATTDETTKSSEAMIDYISSYFNIITQLAKASKCLVMNIVSLSDMIEGSYRSWDLYTTGQLVDGPQQKQKKEKRKRKPVFIKRK